MRDATDEVLPITTPERSGPALGLFDDVLYGGFVESAGVFFGIVKTLGQKGEEAVPGFELAAEGAQGEGQALAGGGGRSRLLWWQCEEQGGRQRGRGGSSGHPWQAETVKMGADV